MAPPAPRSQSGDQATIHDAGQPAALGVEQQDGPHTVRHPVQAGIVAKAARGRLDGNDLAGPVIGQLEVDLSPVVGKVEADVVGLHDLTRGQGAIRLFDGHDHLGHVDQVAHVLFRQ